MKKNNQTHALLLALVGGYVWYIAYQILQGLLNGTSDMAKGVAIALTAFFGLAGVAVFVYTWTIWRKKDEEENEEQDDASEKSMK